MTNPEKNAPRAGESVATPPGEKTYHAEPAPHPPGQGKPKGIFRRFLDRLTRANEKEFGKGGPTCCN